MNVLELGFNLRGGGCKMKDETNIKCSVTTSLLQTFIYFPSIQSKMQYRLYIIFCTLENIKIII